MNISFKNNLVAGGPKYNTFKELPNINKVLLENVERLNYKRMTVIQRAIIPLVLAGKDVMGFSHTGTGKTLSFLLPVFNKMITEGPPDIESKIIFKLAYNNKFYAPVTLVLVPTHELVEQIYKESRKLVSRTGISITKLYGGVPFEPQLK